MTHRSKPSRAAISASILVSLLVLVSIVPLGVVAQSGGESEPNDARAAATPLEDSISGEIVVSGGTDWYSSEFTKGETVSFVLTKPARKSGLNITLYAPNGSKITRDSAYDGVGRAKVMMPATQSGTYYVEVKAVNTSDNKIPYTIYTPAEIAPPKQTRTTTVTGSQRGSEPNDVRSNADVIRSTQISGEVSSSKDTDWYSFQATNNENVSILITKPEESYDLLIKSYVAGSPAWETKEIITIEEDDTRALVVLPIKRSGTHYIKVVAQTSGELSTSGDKYTLQLSGQAPPLQRSPSTTTPTAASTQTMATPMMTPTQLTADNTQATPTATSIQKGAATSTDTTTANTPVATETTSMFGPGFTSVGAIIALLSAALFTARRR